MTSINFLGIGPPKCGSIWLYKNQKKSDEIFIPPEKEINSFSSPKKFENGYDWYLEKFKCSANINIRGEISTSYIYLNEKKIRDISRHFPDLKIIFF